ncbi:MAG TPA: hypothetical protein VLV45_05530 [Gemmatimonadales bacterium]|nr:hypothetical protein [Gemmatimonadales bacterium]
MNTLPTKREPPHRSDDETPPTWQELGERFRDVLKDLERELEPKLVPFLNRVKRELETLIEKLEARTRRLRDPHDD